MSGPEELLKTLHKRKVALQKRGWGRLAELGETYYEYLVSDDNVSIKSLKHDKHFWELFTSKEEFRASIIQALVAHNYGMKVEPFFEVVIEKTVEKDLGVACQLRIYLKIVETLA